jgi:DMSO/TMAO reductase YedYZ molybdopterin-dependent catalytic subunit
LPVKHGYPIRALWPGRYGQKQPKWLQRITIQRQPYTGHWEGQGWSDEARIQPTSIIQQPPERQLQPADFFIAGIANTTDVGLDKVEVSIDNGDTWQTAELLRGPSPLVWTHWWIYITGLQSGVYRVLARTTDNSGRTQVRADRGTRLLDSTFPDGTNEMHQVAVQVKTEG